MRNVAYGGHYTPAKHTYSSDSNYSSERKRRRPYSANANGVVRNNSNAYFQEEDVIMGTKFSKVILYML